jgi:hypothetical protein
VVDEDDKSIDNLYYTQLLRKELRPYHFWSYGDPIENGGEMRHGLIPKGAPACYKIDGDNVISNVRTENQFNQGRQSTRIPLTAPGMNGQDPDHQEVGGNRLFTEPEATTICLDNATDLESMQGEGVIEIRISRKRKRCRKSKR